MFDKISDNLNRIILNSNDTKKKRNEIKSLYR